MAGHRNARTDTGTSTDTDTSAGEPAKTATSGHPRSARPPRGAGGQDDELVIYGTGWCPDVRRSRTVLDRAGIPYRYVDLEHDADATRLVRRLQKGKRRIPTLVWPDGHHLVEPSDDELRTHLSARAVPGSARSAPSQTSTTASGAGDDALT